MPTNREKQVIFAIAPGSDMADGIPVLTFLIPEAGWDYMRNGMSHDFDLTNVGLPLKIVIGRTKNHATGMALLEPFLRRSKNLIDAREVDVGFRDKTKQ